MPPLPPRAETARTPSGAASVSTHAAGAVAGGGASASNRNQRIIALRREGVGPKEIARRLEISPSAVNGVLVRAGMTEPSCGRGNGLSPAIVEIIRAAVASGESRASVARRWGVSRPTVNKYVRTPSREGV